MGLDSHTSVEKGEVEGEGGGREEGEGGQRGSNRWRDFLNLRFLKTLSIIPTFGEVYRIKQFTLWHVSKQMSGKCWSLTVLHTCSSLL